jgi:uncharacterized membrane protein
MVTGIGVAGTLDEVILHQVLQWHHFYDRSTPTVGILSDGLFHIFSTVAIVGGLLYAFAVRSGVMSSPERFYAGIYLGLGGFNLYDGVIQHKVLKIHQIRAADPNQLPYDAAFIGAAVIVLAVGMGMLRVARRRAT